MTVAIVGSGVAGVSAALRLADRGIHCHIFDVGQQPAADEPVRENFYHLRQRQDAFALMIGEQFERIPHLSPAAPTVPAKLTPPRMQYVTRDAERLSPLRQDGYAAVQSFAAGGLANAWGAGLYRFNQRDLTGFPLRAADLSPYYDRLSAEIGISGDADDLLPFYGSEPGLQPPLRLSEKARWLLARYQRRRAALNGRGVFLGRPRSAVLTEPKPDRPACDYSSLEFWQPELPYIYTPAFTLRRLIQQGRVTYHRGVLVRSWSRDGAGIRIHAQDLQSGAETTFDTDELVLAAGAIGSARLALQSRNDRSTCLNLLDNPTLQIPLILPWFIGRAFPTDCFGLTQLVMVCDLPQFAAPLQAAILEVTSPARSEFFSSIPLAARGNLQAIRWLVPAMLVMQLFLPAAPDQAASLRLATDGALAIRKPPPADDRGAVSSLLGVANRLGALAHRGLIVAPPAGQGIHYAGTLPMSESPCRPYQCDRFGNLFGEPGVSVVDGAVFPALPAKNYSFSVMANAMRIADSVADRADNRASGGRRCCA
jgi:choline dehydrogenase-like flavoprotein